MTIAIRTSVAISSGGISAQLIRLLPPAGCPGEAVWVPPNEVQRWEQLGFFAARYLQLIWNWPGCPLRDQPVISPAALQWSCCLIRAAPRLTR